MKRFSWSGIALASTAFLVACGGANETVTTQTSRAGDRSVALRAQALENTVQSAPIDRRLRQSTGKVDVWVALDQNSLARTRALLAQTSGMARVRALSAAGEGRREASAIVSAMSSQRATVLAQQKALSSQLGALGATVLGSVSVAHNAIAVTVDASQLRTIGTLPGVLSVRPVLHYELHLSETVPYVGAAAVQAGGVDGTGVKVAVLDSGIDYTHRNLGGSGSLADYAAATANPAAIPAGLYPTAKVVGGYDFVGSTWSPSAGTRTEDPNPIDDGPEGGHGTNVADIIAGKSLDGTHKGVAPGASLLAVKVCSSVSTSCNGIALLKGMDFALDPNGDGDLSDAVDVINMSLGSSYGQIEDDLSGASANAVALGVVVVASAGNSANRPYITGSPASTPGVISVAQTQVPGAVAFPLVVSGITPSIINNTALVDWAPVGAGFNGPVARLGRGCPAGSVAAGSPDDPYFNGNSPAGKVALIDRGGCSISLKVDRATKAGALAVILANNAGGDPPSFSFGGGDLPMVPTVVITQADGTRIKNALGATGLNPAVVASVSPAVSVALKGSMVASSARGPGYNTSLIKPEIGAPGASVSADYGTGTGTVAFGGTSGAAPMVAGAAALLLSAHPTRSPMEIKAMLMNSADNQIFTNPAVSPGVLAPITRIGAGELRVNRALSLPAVAWDSGNLSATLSFGAVEADKQITLSRTLTLKNFSANAMQFSVAKGFRYADDEASGAVTLQSPTVVNVPAKGTASLKVTMLINPTKLPEWGLNGGSQGGNGAALNGPEYDGYVTLTSGSTTLNVPWHVLPRKASNTSALSYSPSRSGTQFTLKNVGATDGDYEMFSLMATSGKITPLPGPGDNFAVVDIKEVGVRLLPAAVFGDNYLEFAISTHGRRAHPTYPGGFEVDIDVNGDGTVDYFVFQQELTGFAATGQSLVYVQKVGTTTANAFFFNDADLNSGNVIFSLPLSALGVGPTATLTFSVFAYDNYFTGAGTDFVGGMKFTPATPRFAAPDGVPFGTILRAGTGKVPFAANAVGAGSSTEQGVLMMFRRNSGSESQAIPLAAPAAP